MEVEGAAAGQVERTLSGGGGSISVSLHVHPLVIMNISDHFAQVRCMEAWNSRPRVGVERLPMQH